MWAVRLAVTFGLVSRAGAVLVTEGSPCRPECGNVLDSTTEEDIVCADNAFASEDAGILFEQCLTCELSSAYHNENNETDVDALVYNIRYSLANCVFGIPDDELKIQGPCGTSEACLDYLPSINYKNLSTDIDSYDHCDSWPLETEDNHLETCTDCLRVQQHDYLANFIMVLQGSCEQRPPPGVNIGLDGDVFSPDFVNLTAPTPEVSVDPAWFDQGPLNVGAKAGIVAGGIVLILIVTGCFIVWRGKRRRRAFLRTYQPSKFNARPRTKGWPSPLNMQGMTDLSDTPLSQKPLRAWDDSPMSAQSEQPFQRYFSPYSSQFNTPVSATDAQHVNWPVMNTSQTLQQQQQQNVQRNIGLALGGDDSSTDNGAKGKDGGGEETYELQRVDSSGRGSTFDTYEPSPPSEHSYMGHSRTYSGSYRNFPGRGNSEI